MTLFRYTARTVEGEALEGAMEAPSAEAAADNLAESGLTPVRIEPALVGRARGLRITLGGRKVRREELILFSRQLGTLLRAGVPIIRALRGLLDMTHRPLMSKVLEGLVEDLEGGRNLSAAMARHPRVFSNLYRSMIEVGENIGQMDDAFFRMAAYLDQEKETVDRVKSVLRYPSFVLTAIVAAIGVISFVVIPSFERMFRQFKAELPLPTRILMGTAEFAQQAWPILLLLGILLFFGLRRYLGTETGRLRWDRNKLKIPVVGDILLRIAMSRFARTFAMSYGAGVPLVRSLNLTAQATGNLHVGNNIEEIREGIERGDTLTRSAGGTGLFPPLVLQMLAVGEETGAVDTMMSETADFYDREIDYDLKYLASAVEPFLVIAMGVMVLILALGVFLPMWDMVRAARIG